MAKHPDKLAQYALLGFAPRGTSLKKGFILTLLEETTLDNHNTLQLELTPESNTLRQTISKIHIWVDQANWRPFQQRIYHHDADTHLTLRYANLSLNDRLDKDLFKPKWPKGTRKAKD